MRRIDTSFLSTDECWGVQINGTLHCKNCKWTAISACEGKRIVKTGRNSKGYRIGENGIISGDYDPAFDFRKTEVKAN
ncbi:MAG: hypothetical protein U5Q03_20510 [Bacteroidota bacterium]|nr:hypothetical protein [Bacteroidota bacterium]